MLRSKRQQIHADIATILQRDFPELVENQPEVLAFHYQEAGNHQLAIHRWFESGQRALAIPANVEAIANFRKALQLLNALPEAPERTKQEIDIQLALGIPLIAVQGYAAAETREAFSRLVPYACDSATSPNIKPRMGYGGTPGWVEER